MEKRLLTVAEAAALAGLSKNVAYRLAATGELPGLVKLPGTRMLVRRSILEEWLGRRSGEPPISGEPAPKEGASGFPDPLAGFEHELQQLAHALARLARSWWLMRHSQCPPRCWERGCRAC